MPTRIKYTGTALPTAAETVTIFNSVTAFPGANYFQMLGLKRLSAAIKHDQSGTLKGYKSRDRGVNWEQVYDSGAIAAPAATSETIRDILVENYADYKLEWVNGATIQGKFMVDTVLTDERGVAT